MLASMRLALGLVALAVIAIGVAAGFAFWPGLISALEEFSLLVAADLLNFEAALSVVAPALTYVGIAAATVIVVFLSVRQLTGDR